MAQLVRVATDRFGGFGAIYDLGTKERWHLRFAAVHPEFTVRAPIRRPLCGLHRRFVAWEIRYVAFAVGASQERTGLAERTVTIAVACELHDDALHRVTSTSGEAGPMAPRVADTSNRSCA
jgi:hypothetical protein